ncbi:hypothetical protein DFH08DRAFT_35660 [Mycena albidolilacea]|uniref:F-box domain-containing protein n=1 Tax=Mycena albidolilacea TaxID=1033008 RepID=A0AAD7F7A6_9AGAR|nr:hypothetical protein DFH08DRAFT_35660 [Mycena albidolilacea]
MASQASRKRLHDLVEDVLFVILIECDVAGVLALSETSRFFHHLAFTNTVWHSLVTELVQRGFIDHRSDDEDLKDLSTEQLISIVKRILHGPKAWADKPSNAYSEALRRSLNLFRKLVQKPAVEAAAPLGEAKRIVLHPEIAQGPAMSPFADKWNMSKLLPGGKYVLFLNSARLECWSVFEDRLVWTHRPSMDLAWVHDFEVEMIECDLAVILTCQRIDPGKLFVEISTSKPGSPIWSSSVGSRTITLSMTLHTSIALCVVTLLQCTCVVGCKCFSSTGGLAPVFWSQWTTSKTLR